MKITREYLRKLVKEELSNLNEEENYIDDAIKALNDKLRELGFKGKVTEKDFGQGYRVVDKAKITNLTQKQHGIFSAIFDEVSYTVRVGGHPTGKYSAISIQVSWEYKNGGSNGSEFNLRYDATSGKWNK